MVDGSRGRSITGNWSMSAAVTFWVVVCLTVLAKDVKILENTSVGHAPVEVTSATLMAWSCPEARRPFNHLVLVGTEIHRGHGRPERGRRGHLSWATTPL